MEDSLNIVDATTKTEIIPSHRPDAKTRRYDRQLRLWASAGQRSLEQARVLLVGADGGGTQALKNLVLPGIAHFTVLAPNLTSQLDVSTNFFLHPTSVGKPAAEEVVKYLKELNPSVSGDARIGVPFDVLKSDPSFFTSYTIIISSNVNPAFDAALSDLLWQHSETAGNPDIPLITVRSSGFIGRMSIQLREHCVVDTHPENTHTLRIGNPFSALEIYARALNTSSMDSMDYSHIPYVVLLVKLAAEWRDSHGGKAPETDEEKKDFKALLKKGRRKGDEENFDEADAQVYQVWNPAEVSSDLKRLLSEESVQNVSQNSKNLHILLHALRVYLQTHTLPPLSPTLPDMHSSTTSYIALQQLYKSQFQSDLAEYRQCLHQVLASIDLPADAIPDEEVESFAKNSGGVDIIKGSHLRAAKEGNDRLKEAVSEHLGSDWSENNLAIAEHLAFMASERYFEANYRWPGTLGDDTTIEQAEVLHFVQAILGTDPAEFPEDISNAIAEIVRCGFATLPTTAAFIGGLVAQEAIKLVTNQYMPLDNTVIIDLIKSTTRTFKF